MLKNKILLAARAEAIPEGWSGLWFVKKYDLPRALPGLGRSVIPAGIYTHLFRVTDSALHRDPPGMVVMEDTPLELCKHLNFMLRARDKVLVTGLGLGCVVRGLLANPGVAHVTCIEKSADVLKLVRPYMPQTDRLTIIQADALEWTKDNGQAFDYAWHDLWTDEDSGEPHLVVWHAELIFNCADTVRTQGAWALPRDVKRYLKDKQISIV